MKKVREILRLKFGSHLSHRQIGRALNISPGTISYYVQAAVACQLSWPLPEGLTDHALIALLEPVAKQLSRPAKSYAQPEWSEVRRELAQKHMTLILIWENYVNDNPQRSYSYAQFTRHYKKWCKQNQLSMRQEHKPGEEAYIDYVGDTIPIYCRQTGKVLFDAQIFLMVLGASHYTFAHASSSQSLPNWIDAHVRAFDYFGGVPRILVPDNLKAGITDSCQFEPEANRTYADMAEYYGTAIIPARPHTPKDKAAAETTVLVAERWIMARLAKQKFYSLNALNNAISELLLALNNKPFQKRQGTRYQQFIDVERPALSSLPVKRYEFAALKYQTVPPDHHIRLDGHYYSVPYELVGEQVLCRITQTAIEIFYNHERVASHLRSFIKDTKTTNSHHMPKHHRDYVDWSTDTFLDWARTTGDGVMQLAKLTIESKLHPKLCAKFHFGLRALNKRFGSKRLNLACRRAIASNCIKYKNIQSILVNKLDLQPFIQAIATASVTSHSNIRGADYYQTLTTNEESEIC